MGKNGRLSRPHRKCHGIFLKHAVASVKLFVFCVEWRRSHAESVKKEEEEKY